MVLKCQVTFTTLSVIGVGMGRSKAQVQIWEVIVSDFIRDTDYFENKAIARSAQTLAVTTCRLGMLISNFSKIRIPDFI